MYSSSFACSVTMFESKKGLTGLVKPFLRADDIRPYFTEQHRYVILTKRQVWSMEKLPKRKPVRIGDYDYSTPGAYFITICTANREKIFWSDRRGELCSPANNAQTGDHRSHLRVELSSVGNIVESEIQKTNSIYDAVRVDKYCIMRITFILLLPFIPMNTGERSSPLRYRG